MKTTIKRIRELLLQNPDGMTILEICAELDLEYDNTAKRLKNAYGCYIDRWAPSDNKGPMVQVWCCVPVPEHCPRPDKKKPPKPVAEVVPYVPDKTKWVKVPAWSNEGASA